MVPENPVCQSQDTRHSEQPLAFFSREPLTARFSVFHGARSNYDLADFGKGQAQQPQFGQTLRGQTFFRQLDKANITLPNLPKYIFHRCSHTRRPCRHYATLG